MDAVLAAVKLGNIPIKTHNSRLNQAYPAVNSHGALFLSMHLILQSAIKSASSYQLNHSYLGQHLILFRFRIQIIMLLGYNSANLYCRTTYRDQSPAQLHRRHFCDQRPRHQRHA